MRTGRTLTGWPRCPARRPGWRGLRMGKRFDSRSGAVKETRLWRYRVREGIFTNCYRAGHIPQASAVAPGLPTVVISFSIHLALGGRISGLCAKKAPRGAEVREARFS